MELLHEHIIHSRWQKSQWLSAIHIPDRIVRQAARFHLQPQRYKFIALSDQGGHDLTDESIMCIEDP